MNRRIPIRVGLLLALAALSLVLMGGLNERQAVAQCGSSVSSCKNCHEVQGQDPVNNEGEWHTAHAFGDFCEFCHAGDVQATDKEAAHQGLVAPLGDVQASCQSCHPNDYMDLAQQYAGVLGVEVGTGGGGGAPPAGEAPSAPSAPPSEAPAAPAAAGPVSAPSGGEIIDLNKVYAESQAAEQPRTNVSNLVLIALILLLALVFLGLVWHFEQVPSRLAAWWRANMLMEMQAALAGAPAAPPSIPSPGEVRPYPTGQPAPTAEPPALAEVIATLAEADPATLEAIARLLSNRPLGPQVLKAVSRLDLNLLSAVTRLDPEEVELLMALRKELS